MAGKRFGDLPVFAARDGSESALVRRPAADAAERDGQFPLEMLGLPAPTGLGALTRAADGETAPPSGSIRFYGFTVDDSAGTVTVRDDLAGAQGLASGTWLTVGEVGFRLGAATSVANGTTYAAELEYGAWTDIPAVTLALACAAVPPVVETALASVFGPPIAVAADRAADASELGRTFVATGAGAVTLTLPAANAQVVAGGRASLLLNGATAKLTVARTGADTINGAASIELAPGAWSIVQASAAGKWMAVPIPDLVDYADNTAFRKGQLVKDSAGIVWLALADVADTNTDAPAEGATWTALNDVRRADLAGHEDDFYAGDYRPGFLQATELDKRYAWAVASSDGSAAPVQADIYTQANLIAAGDRTLIVSETMWGKIPGDTDWPPLPTHAVTADDMAGILNAHAASPPDGKNYVKFTPTGVATKVGAGNGAYWWIPVTVALEGNVAGLPGGANGYIWRISAHEPSTLDIDLSWRVIADPPWLLASGEDLSATFATALVELLEGAAAVLKRWRTVIQGNNETQTLSVTRVGVNPAAAGQVSLQGLNNGIGQLIFWPPAQTKGGVQFDVEDLREFKSGDFLSYGGLEWEIGDTPWVKFGIGQTSLLTASVMLADGYVYDAADVPALNATADFVLEGRDIHLGLVITAILKRAANNLAGKGGAAGAVWAYVSGATDATWRSLLVVLKADADTNAKRAAYRAALQTGRLQLDIAGSGDQNVTAEQAAYGALELTGARTGDRDLILPAAAAGFLLINDLSTGAYDTTVRAAGQGAAAAATLAAGDNVVLHHGGSVAVLGAQRRWYNSDIGGSDEDIAQNLHDDDWVTVFVMGQDSSNYWYSDGDSFRFGDLGPNDTRHLLGTANNQGAILSVDGTDLQARRNTTGLSSAKSYVYAERRTYDDVALS